MKIPAILFCISGRGEAPILGAKRGLIEREAELAALSAGLGDAAAAGQGGVLLITGPPGIGKTSLLAAARAEGLGRGFTVLGARGAPLERDLPNAIVRALFERVARSDASLYRGFAGLARPLFEPLRPDGSRASVPAPEELVHAIYWMVVNLASERPLALIVDDAHDGDDASLATLAYLAARMDGLAALLVVAARPVSPAAGELAAIGEAAGPAGRLEPPGLTREGASSVLEGHLGARPSAALSRACFNASEGNPELVEVLAEEADGERSGAVDLQMLAPATVVKVVLERFNLLGAEERAIAEATAILGAHATVPRIAALAGLDPGQVGACLARLVGGRLLMRGLPPSFAQATIAESVADQIDPSRRSLLHQAAADLLASEGLGADVQAIHLLHTEPAGNRERAPVLLEAGTAARRGGAPEAAIRLLERALGEPPDPGLQGRILVELGRSEAQIGDRRAIDTLGAAVECSADARAQALASRHLARALIRFERWREAADVLTSARQVLGDAEPELAADLEASALIAAWTGGRAAGRDERLMEVEAGLGTAAVPARARALTTMTWIAATEGASADRVHELAAEVVQLGYAHEQASPAELMGVVMAIGALTAVDEHETAERATKRLLAETAEHAPYAHPLAAALAIICLWRRGLFIDALGYEQAVLAGVGPDHPASGALIAVLVESGRLDEAERLSGPEAAAGTGDALTLLGWEMGQFARARLFSERGRHAEAAAEFEAAGQTHLRHGVQGPSLIAWRSQAGLAHLRAGDRDRALHLIEEELELADAYGAEGSIGVAMSAAGVLAGGDRGARLLAEAADLLEAAGLHGERATAAYELGALTRRAGRNREARDHLRRAFDLSTSIGAAPLARRCREELTAAGARPRRAALRGPASLTPGERRVAEAAARGLTNRAIAAELFLSVKTVEMHLSNSYGKLEIRGRGGLAAAIGDSGDAQRAG